VKILTWSLNLNLGLKKCATQPTQISTKKVEEPQKPVDLVPDKELVKRFVKFLHRTQILTGANRIVKKSDITDVLQKERKNFKLPFEEVT
jgi:hypothetical protein